MLIEDLEDIIKNLNLYDLIPFMYDYINEHTYIHSKRVAKAYLAMLCGLQGKVPINLRVIYFIVLKILTCKFSHFISPLRKSGIIIEYNRANYKVIDNEISLEDFKEIVVNHKSDNNKSEKDKSICEQKNEKVNVIIERLN